MAVPQDITGISAIYGRPGPFFVNGAVYICALATSNEIAVWKADDPDSASFAIQDASNNPNAISYGAFGCWVEGTDICVLALENVNDGDLRYSTFDTTTDAWSTGDDYEEVVATKVGVGGIVPALMVRGTGDPLIGTYNDIVKFMGTNQWQLMIGRRTTVTGTGSWTVGIRYSVADDSNFWGSAMLLGSSDRVHMAYLEQPEPADQPDLNHRSYTSGNSLNTEQTVIANAFATGSQTKHKIGNGARYDVGGTIHIRYPYYDHTGSLRVDVIEADSADNPSWTTGVEASTHLTSQIAQLSSLVNDPDTPSTLHLVSAFNAGAGFDGDIYHNVQADGGSWGTETAPIAASVSSGDYVHAMEAYDHGTGNVIGVFYVDTVWRYDEISLAAAAEILPAPKIVHQAVKRAAYY